MCKTSLDVFSSPRMPEVLTEQSCVESEKIHVRALGTSMQLSWVITDSQSPRSFLSTTLKKAAQAKACRLWDLYTICLSPLVPERCLQACRGGGMLLAQAERKKNEVGTDNATLRRSPTPTICCLCSGFTEHREDEDRGTRIEIWLQILRIWGPGWALSLNPRTPTHDTSPCLDFLTQQQG